MLKQYKIQAKNFFQSTNFKSNAQAQGIYALTKRTKIGIDEIDHDDFVQSYKPYTLKNEFLPTQLGKVFWDYYVKYRSNQVNQFENEKNGKSYYNLTEEEFINKHGEKPWELANRVQQYEAHEEPKLKN